jgi:hypothetical protein
MQGEAARSTKKRSIQTYLSSSSSTASVSVPPSSVSSSTTSTISSISLITPSFVPHYKPKECFEYFFTPNLDHNGYVKCLCGKSIKWDSSMGYHNPMSHLSHSHPQFREVMWESNQLKISFWQSSCWLWCYLSKPSYSPQPICRYCPLSWFRKWYCKNFKRWRECCLRFINPRRSCSSRMFLSWWRNRPHRRHKQCW